MLLAMFLGIGAGLALGPDAKPLGDVGKLFIQLIKALAIPLVFFSIVEAVIATSISRQQATKWLMVIALNTSLALCIGLMLSNVFTPGVAFKHELYPTQAPSAANLSLNVSTVFSTVFPKSIVEPFAENNILAVVLLAILIGVATRSYLNSGRAEVSASSVERGLKAAFSIVSLLLLWLTELAPAAVLCVTAKTVGESGLAPFIGLSMYVGLAIAGMILQIVVVYSLWILAVARVPLREFVRVAHAPIVHAFGTNSSLATLPLTLQALDSLGVRKSSSRLGACIGTNFNNDGILLYEALAVLFVAQAFGIDLTLGQQVFAACISLLAAIGVAGVPEAGVVSLSLVLVAVGLPVEIVPLLLTVDWIVARVRSVTNVLSDMTISLAVDALVKERAGR
jgi:DAACS family dicarboxylate/amino acid:cation (Na+ or H+) symporter